MGMIPELSAACEINDRMRSNRLQAAADAVARRNLWLRASAKGASRAQIVEACGVSPSVLEAELRKAREETTDPKLKKPRGPARGLTLGTYWCPEPGCARHKNGDAGPYESAQALGMHRMRAHGHRANGHTIAATAS